MDPLDAAFLAVVGDRTAGDPMRGGVRWTNLSARRIAKRLAAAGFAAGRRAGRRRPRRHRFGRRKLAETRAVGHGPDRDAQFTNVARLKGEYLARGDPVLSIDTKKREFVGDLFRPGTAYATRRTRHGVRDTGYATRGYATRRTRPGRSACTTTTHPERGRRAPASPTGW